MRAPRHRSLRIIQLVLGEAAKDPRVRRSAWALRSADHEVLFVDRSARTQGLQSLARMERIDGMEHWAMSLTLLNRWDLAVDRLPEHRVVERATGAARRTLIRQVSRVAGLLQRPRRVMHRMSRFQPDVIHAHDLFGFEFVAEHARAAGIPVIYDAHELERGKNAPTWSEEKKKAHADLERRLIGLARGVITVAPAIASILERAYGIARPTVVMNAPPRSLIRENTALRQRLGLPSDHRVVLYLGGIAAGRGIERLLAALRLLPERVHVALIGPVLVAYRERFERLLQELAPWRHRIHLLGPKPYEELLHEAWGADLGYNGIELACESYQNALPNKFFEYVFADVPVLSTPQTDPIVLTHEYGLGRIVPDGDAEELASAIERALADQLRIPSELRLAFIDRYCWEAQAETLVSLYDRIL